MLFTHFKARTRGKWGDWSFSGECKFACLSTLLIVVLTKHSIDILKQQSKKDEEDWESEVSGVSKKLCFH